MLFLFSKKQVAFVSLLFGLPILIFGFILLTQNFIDYLFISLVLIIGSLLVIGGIMIYKDSLK